ncbi:MAG: hypothetical protein IPL99_00540 [Candidatus Competibacteraceae bacterium]|nr:hypothetical protein [Candidatus Competibacteraceae bacterium]
MINRIYPTPPDKNGHSRRFPSLIACNDSIAESLLKPHSMPVELFFIIFHSVKKVKSLAD